MPPTVQMIIERVVVFPDTATFGNYISHRPKTCQLPHSQTATDADYSDGHRRRRVFDGLSDVLSPPTGSIGSALFAQEFPQWPATGPPRAGKGLDSCFRHGGWPLPGIHAAPPQEYGGECILRRSRFSHSRKRGRLFCVPGPSPVAICAETRPPWPIAFY